MRATLQTVDQEVSVTFIETIFSRIMPGTMMQMVRDLDQYNGTDVEAAKSLIIRYGESVFPGEFSRLLSTARGSK